jgi:hypothetical protein
MENLMVLLIDLGSWRRITLGCACRRNGLLSTSVGVNTIVFCLSSMCHGFDGCTESSACSSDWVAWNRLSRVMAVWFFMYVCHLGEVLVEGLYCCCSEEVEGGCR